MFDSLHNTLNYFFLQRYVDEQNEKYGTPVYTGPTQVKIPKVPINHDVTQTFSVNNEACSIINYYRIFKLCTNFQEILEDLNGSLIEDDDLQKDPDWRNTPLGKRVLEEKRKLIKTSLGKQNLI